MKLEEYIKSTGMSTAAWAKTHGFAQPTIHRLIRGRRNVTLKLALRIQEATFGRVKMEELLNGQ